MNIWIVNPFDQLPNETDVPLRYWSLCKTFATQGHDVIWWSSDYSHLTKTKRSSCPDSDDFSVQLIETPPYTKNISFVRLKNHKAFANGFYNLATHKLNSGNLKAPDRIIVSLPPLGVAEQAFKIRDLINNQSPIVSHPSTTSLCEVVVDIMDAWPETFYQVLPKPLRKLMGPLLLAPMHRSAKRAYQGADKISAVGQSYLELAQKYLGQASKVGSRKCEVSSQESGAAQDSAPQAYLLSEMSLTKTDEEGCSRDKLVANPQSNINYLSSKTSKPMFLCYHGTDLYRFQRDELGIENYELRNTPHSYQPSAINHKSSLNKPLKAVYLGSMGQGYDLITIIQVAARWKAEGQFPFQIHFAGTGSQLKELKSKARKYGLLPLTSDQPSAITDQSSIIVGNDSPLVLNDSSRIVFHDYLQKEAINILLMTSDLALVPNRDDSLVACPYKASEYAAAGLPMLSCLSGELNRLLSKWNAGTKYTEGNAESLHIAFQNYLSDPDRLKQQSLSARKMAETLFNREKSYEGLANFISLA